MKRQSEALQKSVVNSKSMRDNLVFICISERDDEGCKQVIQNFMKTKLKLDFSFETAQNCQKIQVPNETVDNCG